MTRYSCLIAALLLAGTAAAADRPNVVLIMADDLGYEGLSCNGSTSYKTPNLDALAKGGTRFTHCYGTPLCSPSRVQIMTGRYPFRTGWTRLIGGPQEFFDPARERTFAHQLKEAGYATAIAGKWQLCDFSRHPDHLKQCGFDEHCMWTWLYGGQKKEGRTSRYWDPSVWHNGKLRTDVKGRYGPDVYNEFVVDFIARHKEKPFFVYYPMALVHGPFEPTPDNQEKAGKGKGKGKGDNRRYADMIAYMDKLVGRVVAELDKQGLRERTLILFTGDNGCPKNITSRMGDVEVPGGKGNVSEIGAHVPLVAHWKGTTPAGKVSSDLIDFSDVLPTLCELAGAPLPKGVKIDGVSFAPQVRGEKGKPREWVYSQLGQRRFVRDARWLLHGDGRVYDVEADPFEKMDLQTSTDAAPQDATKRLKAVLDRLK